MSTEKASENTEIRIYGKFLTTENQDGDKAKSYVYLTNGDSYYEAEVLKASPYRVTIKLPKGLKEGENYSIWLHNGHGGEYGWSNPLTIQYSADAENFWNGTEHTVEITDGIAYDNVIRDLVQKAKEGDTIYFPAGTYIVRNPITVKKSLRFIGEGKDKVKIIGVFAKTKSINTSLAYGDLNTNSKFTPVFDVSATPCEFSGFTFTDYVKGAKNCTEVTAPERYDINYAHGTFIRATDPDEDTGVSGEFKVSGCDFIINRCYSKITNCIYFTQEEQEENHEKYGSPYEFYSTSSAGSAPLWIETNRTEITNCYFETPKEIITRGMHNSYISGNTFVGTWIMAGNSGPAAIADNFSQNIDISNNRIYGMDEITDPDGYVVTGDQTFARTIVLQKTLGMAKNQYVMNNNVSRVGELNYGSGEHILFEEEGVTYVGKATLSNGNKTLHLKDMPTDKWTSDNQFEGYITVDDGQIKPAGYSRSVVGQVVIISKGKGVGQWRTIVEASADRTITVDRAWDVEPDAHTTFVVAPGFINPVVYNNIIEGPKMYYKNYNSTNGVNAYGTMVGTVIDRNNFSQMQAGLALNPHYNMKSYTYNGNPVAVDFNFAMFADLLVMNNTISDTRYGIWNFPSITLSGIDASDEEAVVSLQLGSIIRGNTISNQRKLTGGADTNNTVTEALKKRGGVAIVVGRDYGDASQVLSTRYWMNDIVVENNSLINPENAYLDIALSQNGTIIRNNTFDGKKNLTFDAVNVKHIQHTTGKKPKAPAYFK